MLKVNFISASRRKGLAKATGNPYDICVLSYAVPLEPVSNEKMTFTGHGHQVKEIELSPDAMAQFADVKLGQLVDLDMGANPRDPSRNIVTGLVKS